APMERVARGRAPAEMRWPTPSESMRSANGTLLEELDMIDSFNLSDGRSFIPTTTGDSRNGNSCISSCHGEFPENPEISSSYAICYSSTASPDRYPDVIFGSNAGRPEPPRNRPG